MLAVLRHLSPPALVRRLPYSFSFVAGALIFLALSATLMALRMMIYFQSIETLQQGIRQIIEAHSGEIDEGMKKYGVEYVKQLIPAILEDTHDPHLILALYDGTILAGNLMTWPVEPKNTSNEVEFTLPRTDDDPISVTADLTKYPPNLVLLVGYDLTRIETLHDTLLTALAENAALSFTISLLLSVAIVWLINWHLHRVNQTCERVMTGNLSHRVQLKGVDDQFERLGRNFNAMLDWINTLLVTVRESSNSLAHDMRTPLSRHRIRLQSMLSQHDLPGILREELQASVTEVDSLVEMFDHILSIAKAEGRSDTEHFTRFDLKETVADVVDFYELFMEQKSLRLTLQLPDQEIPFHGDRQLVAQALANLIDNAIKYTPNGGAIAITLTAEPETVTITVVDTGPGIPEEYREKVKERFFRLDESRHTPGTGLGLALVDAVARLHQGEFMLAENAPGLRAALVFRREG